MRSEVLKNKLKINLNLFFIIIGNKEHTLLSLSFNGNNNNEDVQNQFVEKTVYRSQKCKLKFEFFFSNLKFSAFNNFRNNFSQKIFNYCRKIV